MIMSTLVFIFSVWHMSLAEYTTGKCGSQKINGSPRCCYYFMPKDKDCIACPDGYGGVKCQTPCTDGSYGRLCRKKCNCSTFQHCHHIHGCLEEKVQPTSALGTQRNLVPSTTHLSDMSDRYKKRFIKTKTTHEWERTSMISTKYIHFEPVQLFSTDSKMIIGVGVAVCLYLLIRLLSELFL